MISTIGAFNTINWKKIYPNVTYLLYYQFDATDLSINKVGNRRNLWNNVSSEKVYDTLLSRPASMDSGLYLDLSANDYMQITTVPDFDKSKGWTVAYWLLSKNNGTNTPVYEFSSSSSSASNLIANYVDNTGLKIQYNDVSNIITDVSFNNSSWNHIVSSVNGTQIITSNYYYRFETSDISVNKILNWSSNIYDATTLNTSAINTITSAEGTGSLLLNSDISYSSVILPSISTTVNGLTLIFSGNSSSVQSHSSVIELGNGIGRDTIRVGVIGNSICTNIINGNISSQPYNFGTETTPFGTSTYAPSTVVGSVISGTVQSLSSVAISADGRRLVMASYNGNIYYSNYDISNSTWSSVTRIYGSSISNLVSVKLNGNGSRGVASAYNGLTYFFYWIDTSNNFSALSSTLDTTARYYSSVAISANGESIACADISNGGHIYYANSTQATVSVYASGLRYTAYDTYTNNGINTFDNNTTYLIINSPPAPAGVTYTGITTNISDISGGTNGYINVNGAETYSVQWLGFFRPDISGVWTFYTNSDDWSYLWIGDNAVSGYTTSNSIVNNGGEHGMREISGTITLTADIYYPLRIQFGENGGGDNMIVSFMGPTGSTASTKRTNGSGFYFNATSTTTVNTYTSFNRITNISRNYTAVDISPSLNTIVYASGIGSNDGAVYFIKYNGNTYAGETLISSGLPRCLNIRLSHDGSSLFYCPSGNFIRYSYWNDTTKTFEDFSNSTINISDCRSFDITYDGTMYYAGYNSYIRKNNFTHPLQNLNTANMTMDTSWNQFTMAISTDGTKYYYKNKNLIASVPGLYPSSVNRTINFIGGYYYNNFYNVLPGGGGGVGPGLIGSTNTTGTTFTVPFDISNAHFEITLLGIFRPTLAINVRYYLCDASFTDNTDMFINLTNTYKQGDFSYNSTMPDTYSLTINNVLLYKSKKYAIAFQISDINQGFNFYQANSNGIISSDNYLFYSTTNVGSLKLAANIRIYSGPYTVNAPFKGYVDGTVIMNKYMSPTDISNASTGSKIDYTKLSTNNSVSNKHTYYVNGVYKGTNNVVLSNISRTSSYIGKTAYTDGPSGAFVGSVGHFIVYNKTFNSSDVLTLYNSYFTPIYMNITGFTQSFSQNTVTLSFKSPNNNILKYRFTFTPTLVDPATGNGYFDVSSNVRTYTFSGLASNTTYTISGVGIGTYGNSGTASVSITTLNSLGNITSLTYAYYEPKNFSTVDISYSEVEGADNYYVSTDGVNYISVGNYLAYTLQNLNPSTDYTVRVYASNVGGSTSGLATVSFFTKGPAQLSNLTFDITQTSSTVTFTDLGYDTQTFEITSPNGFTSSLTPSPISITDLSNGSVYNVVINAVGLYGNTVYDNSFVTIPLITSAVATSSSAGSLTFVQRDGYAYDLSAVVVGGTTIQNSGISSPFTYGTGALQAGRIYTNKLTAIYGTLKSSTHDVSFITYTVAPTFTPTVYDISASLDFLNTPTIDVSLSDFSNISLVYSKRNVSETTIDLIATSSPILLTDLSESTVYDISAISIFKQTRSDLASLSITTYPTPPTNVTATATSSSTSDVNFTPNTSLSYTYDISAIPASGTAVSVTNIAGGSIPYSVTGLISSMSYNINVFARSPETGLKSQYSGIGTVVTYTVAPTVAHTVYDTSASLAFTNTYTALYSGDFSYATIKYTVRNSGVEGIDVSSTTTTILLTDLSESTVYDISAVSYFNNTRSDLASLAITTYPTPPTSVTATSYSSSTSTVNFTSNTTLSYSYDISAVPASGTTVFVTEISGATIPYTFTGLLASMRYNMNVFARSPATGLKSQYSGIGTVVTYTVAPTVAPTVYDTSASLAFTNTYTALYSGDFSYATIKYTVRNSGVEGIDVSSTTTTILLTDLSESTVYDISAVSYFNNTRSDVSNLSITTYPTPPTNVTATATSSSTSDVNFTPNTSLSYTYDISAVPASGSVVSATEVLSGYSFAGLIPSMRYSMNVFAKSPATGLKSQYARTGTVVTYTVAPTISATTVDISSTLTYTNTFNSTYAGNFVRLDASYSAPSITGYYVIALDTNENQVNTYTITTTLPITSYNFTGLDSFTQYTFRIYSVYNGQNSTTYYDISAITNPSAPDGLMTTPISQTSVELSFNMVEGFTYNARFGVTDYLAVTSPFAFTGLSSSSKYTLELQRTSIGLYSVYASVFGYTKTPPITFSYSSILDTYVDISYVLNNTAITGGLTTLYVYYSATGSGIINTATSTSTTGIRVTGLTGSTLYDISLVALYANTMSDPAGGTLQTAPPAPSGLIATVNGTDSITISYDSLQSVIYDVSAISTSGNLSSTGISNPYTFTGLTTSMLYTIYLYPLISGVKGTPAIITAVTYTTGPSVVSTVYDVSASLAITSFANTDTGTLSRNVVTYSVRGAGTPIDVSSAISPIVLDGLSDSTVYDISVVSLYVNTRSLSTSLSVTTYPKPPDTVSSTSLSDTTASVSFSTLSNYAYDISAVPSTGATVGITDISGTQIPYTFTGLLSGTRYTIYVFSKSPTTLLKSFYSRASNAVVTYTTSPTVVSTVYDVSASLAITAFTANADTGTFSRNVVTYSVRGAGIPIDVSSAVSPVVLTGLTESTVYDISVVSLYANTVSTSKSLSITTYPSVPTDTTVTTLSSTSLSVNFTPNTSLNYTYDISGPTSAASVTGINGSSLPYTFTGLTSGTRYTFFIFAISPVTTLRYNNKSSVNTITYVLAPYSLATNNMTSTSMDLSYSVYTPTDAGAFTAVDISYAVRGVGTQSLVSSAANNKYSFTGLTAITIYDISLVARYANTRSEIVGYSFTTLLSTPSYSVATKTNSSIDISFSPTTDVVYDISAIRGGITGSSIVGATTSPQSFTGLVNAGLYTINMFARSIAASTAGVKSLVFSSTAYTLANAVTPTVNSNGYYLNINYSTATQNDSGAFGNVAITYKTDANAPTTVYTTNTSPYNLTGLSPSTTYDISFVANYANTSSVSYFNSYTTLTQPTAPTITDFSYANSLFTTKWTNNATQRTKNVVYIYNNSNVLQHTSPDLLATDVSYSTGAITTSGTYYSKVSVFNQDLSSISINSSTITVNIVVPPEIYFTFSNNTNNSGSYVNSTINDMLSPSGYSYNTTDFKTSPTALKILEFNDTSRSGTIRCANIKSFINNSTFTGLSITVWFFPNFVRSSVAHTIAKLTISPSYTLTIKYNDEGNVANPNRNLSFDITNGTTSGSVTSTYSNGYSYWNFISWVINTNGSSTIKINNSNISHTIPNIICLDGSGTLIIGGLSINILRLTNDTITITYDNLRVYQRPLTDTELTNIYNAGT